MKTARTASGYHRVILKMKFKFSRQSPVASLQSPVVSQTLGPWSFVVGTSSVVVGDWLWRRRRKRALLETGDQRLATGKLSRVPHERGTPVQHDCVGLVLRWRAVPARFSRTVHPLRFARDASQPDLRATSESTNCRGHRIGVGVHHSARIYLWIHTLMAGG
jgi:hypothetical protein